MSFASTRPEYKHLLKAERVAARRISAKTTSDLAVAALMGKLVSVIQLKRYIRGEANPRPIDTLALAKLVNGNASAAERVIDVSSATPVASDATTQTSSEAATNVAG